MRKKYEDSILDVIPEIPEADRARVRKLCLQHDDSDLLMTILGVKDEEDES